MVLIKYTKNNVLFTDIYKYPQILLVLIYFKIYFLINSLINYPLFIFSSFIFCIKEDFYLIMNNNIVHTLISDVFLVLVLI